jgi:4-amino-4-deoxy-L-arabinose transferase-like glycosyltransferase
MLALFVPALWVYVESARTTPFWGDESANLFSARYFTLAFVERNFASRDWGDNYWTLTQPMLPRYLAGSWLWARGFDLNDVARPYNFLRSYEDNLRGGRVPDQRQLVEARMPFAVLGALTVPVLYLVVALLASPLAGIVAGSLAIASPVLLEHSVLFMSEAPLGLLTVLTLLIVAASHGSWRWVPALGIAMGLALAAKLTAGALFLAVAVWVGLVAARRRPGWQSLVLSTGTALTVGLAVFVAHSPHLWNNPPMRIYKMLEQRVTEERERQNEDPARAVRDPLARPALAAIGTLVSGMPFGSRGLPVELALFVAGAVTVIPKAWRSGVEARESFLIVLSLVVFAAITAGLANHHERYFVPTVLLTLVWVGIGAQAIIDRVAAPRPAT